MAVYANVNEVEAEAEAAQNISATYLIVNVNIVLA